MQRVHHTPRFECSTSLKLRSSALFTHLRGRGFLRSSPVGNSPKLGVATSSRGCLYRDRLGALTERALPATLRCLPREGQLRAPPSVTPSPSWLSKGGNLNEVSLRLALLSRGDAGKAPTLGTGAQAIRPAVAVGDAPERRTGVVERPSLTEPASRAVASPIGRATRTARRSVRGRSRRG
jgi:hypothetical protein